MSSIYFEEKGEALLERIGMPKAEFARRMGIQRQNVRVLFRSKDLRVIQRAADVMGMPWISLVGYAEEPDVYQLPVGVRRQDKMKVQYCITALTPRDEARKEKARQPQMRLPVDLPRGRRAGITSGARA